MLDIVAKPSTPELLVWLASLLLDLGMSVVVIT